MTATIRDLEHSLDGWLAWLRLRRMLHWSGRGLTLGLMAAFGFTLAGRLRPLYSHDQLVQLAAAAALTGVLAAAVAAFFWPQPRRAAARYFDLAFNLEERTSTALELSANLIEAPDWLVQQQLDDAVTAAETVRPRAQLPLQVTRVEGLAMAVALALVVASLVIPNEQFAVFAHQQAVKQAIAEQVTQLETLRKDVQENSALTDAQKQELTQPLNDAIKQLQQGNQSQSDAISTLAQTESQLRQLADPNSLAQAQALQQAGQGLAQNPSSQALGEALQNHDLATAAQDLANIDPSQMTAAQQQQLATSLEQAAQQMQGTNPQLAQQLQAAANDLRGGNAAAAQADLQAAAQTMANSASQVAQAQAASSAAAQVSSSRQTVTMAGSAQAGQQGQGQSQQGQGQTQGQGQGQQAQTAGNGQGQQGQGAGQGQGQGQSSSQGQSQGAGQAQGVGQGAGQGAGVGAGSSAGTNGVGGPSGQNNGSTNGGPANGGSTTYEPIYSPYRLGGSGGPKVQLPEQGGTDPNGQIVGQGPSQPPAAGDSTVPYNEVYDQYNQAAQHAMDSDQVPSTLKPVVKNYFSSLQP